MAHDLSRYTFPGQLLARVLYHRAHTFYKRHVRSSSKQPSARVQAAKAWFIRWEGVLLGSAFLSGLLVAGLRVFMQERADDLVRRRERALFYEQGCLMALQQHQLARGSAEAWGGLAQLAQQRAEQAAAHTQQEQRELQQRQQAAAIWRRRLAAAGGGVVEPEDSSSCSQPASQQEATDISGSLAAATVCELPYSSSALGLVPTHDRLTQQAVCTTTTSSGSSSGGWECSGSQQTSLQQSIVTTPEPLWRSLQAAQQQRHQQQQQSPAPGRVAGKEHQCSSGQGRQGPEMGSWIHSAAAGRHWDGRLLPSPNRTGAGDSSSNGWQGVKVSAEDGATTATLAGASRQLWLLGATGQDGDHLERGLGNVQYKRAASSKSNIINSSSSSSSSVSGSGGDTGATGSGVLPISTSFVTSSSCLSSSGSTSAGSCPPSLAAGSRVYPAGSPSNAFSGSSSARAPGASPVPPAAGTAAGGRGVAAGGDAAGSSRGGGQGGLPPGQARCSGLLCRLHQWRCSVALQRLQEAEQRVALAQAGCDTWQRLAEAAQQQITAWQQHADLHAATAFYNNQQLELWQQLVNNPRSQAFAYLVPLWWSAATGSTWRMSLNVFLPNWVSDDLYDEEVKSAAVAWLQELLDEAAGSTSEGA